MTHEQIDGLVGGQMFRGLCLGGPKDGKVVDCETSIMVVPIQTTTAHFTGSPNAQTIQASSGLFTYRWTSLRMIAASSRSATITASALVAGSMAGSCGSIRTGSGFRLASRNQSPYIPNCFRKYSPPTRRPQGAMT